MTDQPPACTPLPFIGAPAYRALDAQGIRSLEEVAQWSERDLLRLHGVGAKAIRVLKEAMAAHGLTFREASAPGAKR